MAQLLQFFILLPLLGFLVSLFLPRKKERVIATVAITTIALYLAGIAAFVGWWLFHKHPVLDIRHIVFFKSHDIEIFAGLYFDKITAVYALTGGFISLMVARFSRTYIHREQGFKRFFSTLLLFFAAYSIIIFSGNFETLFIGWELLGISSFLLIAFYRDRYLPVKNAIKVISVYRLGDICLILTMWMSHQLWHENITFLKLTDTALVQQHLLEHNWFGIFICLMLVIAAATKSAQLPFSSWLPRAMEGPTSSSAIFYGSLSVHLGVFLLLRTYPYWESVVLIKVILVIIGISTSIIASGIARVQSSVKTQIAYSSITQIGFIFVEVALGLHMIALIHFAGNAFLRTYQLLVSPSVLSYQLHNMVFNFLPRRKSTRRGFAQKISNSFYMLSVKEWNLDRLQYRFLWSPFKWIGRQVGFIASKAALVLLSIILAGGIYADLRPAAIPVSIYTWLPIIFSFIGLLLVLRSFTERKNPVHAWLMVFAAQLFMTLSIALLHEDFGHNYMLIYLGGAMASSVTGYICLVRIGRLEKGTSLNRFYGHSYEHPGTAMVFLIACLGIIGFPFTPTFIGIDLLFSHIHKQEIILVIFVALSFIFMELAIMRIYARVFLGQHVKVYHPVAYRSS